MGGKISRKRETITGETLDLASRRGVGVPNDVIYECRLTDCRVRIGYPRGVTIVCSTFVNTTIEVSRTCSDSWRGCFFDSCTFKGKYHSCLFGNKSDECPGRAGLRNCDFTGATLNLCDFLNCTPGDLRLPGWPHITIFSPRQNADDFADLKGDPVLADIHRSMGHTSPLVVAATYSMTAYVNSSRLDVFKLVELNDRILEGKAELEAPEPDASLEAIRELLKRKPYVFM